MQETKLEGTDVLVGLGLSERQAQVYLALLKVGGGRATAVYGLAGTSRQHTYRLFAELSQLGLVRRNLTVPLSYSALPFVEVANLLLEHKTDELIALSKKTGRLAEKLAQIPTTRVESKRCFGKVVGGEKGRGYLTGIQGAEGCFEFISGWRRFRQFCNFFEDELRAVIGRGVRVHVVVEQPPCGFPKWIAELDSAVFEVRTMPTVPAVALCIFDGEQIAVAYEPTSRLDRGPDLWSRHTGLVAACRGYFDTLWSALR